MESIHSVGRVPAIDRRVDAFATSPIQPVVRYHMIGSFARFLPELVPWLEPDPVFFEIVFDAQLKKHAEQYGDRVPSCMNVKHFELAIYLIHSSMRNSI